MRHRPAWSQTFLSAALLCAQAVATAQEQPTTAVGVEDLVHRTRSAMQDLERATATSDSGALAEAGAGVADALGLLKALPQEGLSAKQRDTLARVLEEARSALFWFHQMRLRRGLAGAGGDGSGEGGPPGVDPGEAIAAALLRAARQFNVEHPAELRPARDRFAMVAEEHAGTLASLQAEAEVQRVDSLLAAAAARSSRPAPVVAVPTEPTESDSQTTVEPDRRPYWQRVADQLAAVEPGETGDVRDAVRRHLVTREYVEAYDLARRARADASDAASRGALSQLVSELEFALEVLGLAVNGAPSLVGQTHVFRLGTGTSYPGEVLSFSGSSFRLRSGDDAEFTITLSALSPRGLCQVATATDEPAAYLSAAYFFLLLGELEEMDRYLGLARERGAPCDHLEVSVAIAHESQMLEKELPAARAAWRKITRGFDDFLKRARHRDYSSAVTQLKKVMPLIRDDDLYALDEITIRAVDTSLSRIVTEVRTTCTMQHVDERDNLIACPTCEGDGWIGDDQNLRLDERPRQRPMRCPACSGGGVLQCKACAQRFRDADLQDLQMRVLRVLGQ